MATLKTTLTLDGGQFQRGLMMAERAGKRFNRQFLAPTAELTRRFIRLGVAAAAAGAAIGGFVTRHIMRYGDTLDKLAKRLNTTTAEAARLKHMAELSGTTVEALVSAAARLQRTKPGAGLRETLEALADVEDPARRLQLAQELMGRGAVQLAPLMARGSAAIRDMAADADLLGLTMSGKNVAAAVRLRDQMTRLRGAFTGLMVQLPLDGIANAVSRVTRAVATLRHNAGFRQFVRDVITGSGRVIAAIASIVRHVYRFVVANRQFFQQWGLILLGAAAMFKTGLAQPIILLAYNVGKALVLSLAGAFHFVATKGIGVAILSIGKFLASLALMAVGIGAIILLFRHWHDVVGILGKALWKVAASAENRFRQLWIDMKEGAKATAEALGLGTYTAEDQRKFDEQRRVAREQNRLVQEELDAQILAHSDSLNAGIGADIDAAVNAVRDIAGGIAGAFKLPSFEKIDVSDIFGTVGDLPGVSDLSQPVASGVARGMMRVLNTSFGKLWMGDGESRERRTNARREARENRDQLNAIKSQTDILREMARAGALIF